MCAYSGSKKCHSAQQRGNTFPFACAALTVSFRRALIRWRLLLTKHSGWHDKYVRCLGKQKVRSYRSERIEKSRQGGNRKMRLTPVMVMRHVSSELFTEKFTSESEETVMEWWCQSDTLASGSLKDMTGKTCRALRLLANSCDARDASWTRKNNGNDMTSSSSLEMLLHVATREAYSFAREIKPGVLWEDWHLTGLYVLFISRPTRLKWPRFFKSRNAKCLHIID